MALKITKQVRHIAKALDTDPVDVLEALRQYFGIEGDKVIIYGDSLIDIIDNGRDK